MRAAEHRHPNTNGGSGSEVLAGVGRLGATLSPNTSLSSCAREVALGFCLSYNKAWLGLP